MPQVHAIPAIRFAASLQRGGDISPFIAPPYDVLDEGPKRQLLARDGHNIVAIDLPFTPPKVVGPDEVYARAGQDFREWLGQGILSRGPRPALFIYQQTYTHAGRKFNRRGVIANLRVQDFGKCPDGLGLGGVFAHEQTFASGKEDRLKLMRACKAQLSPIFGLYSDPQAQIAPLLEAVIQQSGGGRATFSGTTTNDAVLHSVWEVGDPRYIEKITAALSPRDIFIADGHHRYNTAINYLKEQTAARGPLPADDPANFCMFVLVAMQDPGMIVLPTHRVLGGMSDFTMTRFIDAAAGRLKVTPFAGTDLAALEKALPGAEPHAVGLFDPTTPKAPLHLAVPAAADPLGKTHGTHAPAWRMLDVALVQHLIVEQICQPRFCPAGEKVKWKFPHTLEQLRTDAAAPGFQLGLILQPTPLEAVRQVSEAGELMPQKSTFFYPKLATGLVINPLCAAQSMTSGQQDIRK